MKRVLQIADLFCGAGGTSTGAVLAAKARGFEVKLTAVNHWPVAIDTHATNHPEARHLCTAVDDVDPRKLYEPHELDVLWASPECTHHSRARGGKPMHDQSRATAWCVTRWAEAVLPGIIFVENVPEFLDWGPLGTNGRPMMSRKGATFRAWVGVLESLGYKVEWRVLCAADYGAPTTRERLFVQAVRGRRRIIWPQRTHAPLAKIEAARTGGDLFGDVMAGVKPWRSAREIIDWDLEGRWLDEMPPKPQYGGLPLSPKTLRRIHAGLRRFGMKHFLVPQFGERDGQSPRCHDVDESLPAVTSHGAGALVLPFLVEHKGTGESQVMASAKDVKEPLSMITTSGGHHSLVEPFIVPIDHTGRARVTVNSIDAPLSTVTTEARHCVVRPYLVSTAHGGDGARVRSVDEPMPTVCGNRGEQSVIEPHLLPQQSCGVLRPVSEPMPTCATAGAIAFVEPFLTKFYGTGGAVSVDEPLDTITTKDRFALVCPMVMVGSVPYRVRLRWRMLQPHELARGMSFPADYQFTGNKTQVVKQIGNAVCPEIANALLGAHLD